MKLRSMVFAVAFALVPAALGWAQADVNESLESVQLYVNTQAGSDTNPGTQAKPLKTIGAAASIAETNNRKKVGTRVIILPGTYRETVTLQATGQDTTAPETFQALTNGTVILSGGDVWTGWQASSGNSKVFVHFVALSMGPVPGSAVGAHGTGDCAPARDDLCERKAPHAGAGLKPVATGNVLRG